MSRRPRKTPSRPARRDYWLMRKTPPLGLLHRLLIIRTALELSPRRRKFIAQSLGGDLLQARLS